MIPHMQGGNNNASLQDSFEHQITSLDISLPFHFLHIDFCALRGNYTNFQTYLLSPQMHTKGYSTSLHIPLVNYLSYAQSIHSRFECSLPTPYSSTLSQSPGLRLCSVDPPAATSWAFLFL